MSFSRVVAILKKDIKRAPRSGIVFLALLYPVLITIMVQLIFGSIFDPKPRVGVIDHGASTVVDAMRAGPVELTEYTPAQADELWQEVRRGNLDVGMVVPEGYDEQVAAGQQVRWEQKMSTRANMQAMVKLEGILLAAVMELLPTQPVEVEQVKLTDKIARSWTDRLLPLIVLLAFFVAGTFLTAFAIVDEKLRGTLRAMLTGPTRVTEVIMAKGVFSFGIAFLASGVALWLNGAASSMSWLLAGSFVLAALMTIELGVVVGFVSKDVNSMYGMVKGMGPLVAVTVMPYLWDGWPAWVSKAIPFWYVLEPIIRIINDGAQLADVALDLGIATVLCGVLMVAAVKLANKRAQHLDALA